MRGEWVDAAYVFDGFIASRMDVLHRAMRVRLRAMAEALGVPAKHLELVMIIASAEADTAGEIAKQLGVSRYRDICAGIGSEELDVFLYVMQRIWKNIDGITARAESAAVHRKGDR